MGGRKLSALEVTRTCLLLGVAWAASGVPTGAQARVPDARNAAHIATIAPGQPESAAPLDASQAASAAFDPSQLGLQSRPLYAAAQPMGAPGINPPALEDALQATARRRAADARISAKWRDLGGSPGAPVIDGETGLIPVADGFYREYSKAKDRIYYRPGAEPLFVYGAIGDKYIKSGGPAGWLGWPKAEEEPFAQGGRAVNFQNGGIYYWPDTGAIDVGNVIIRYAGLYAFGETDNDSGSGADLTGKLKDGDEPYLVFSVLGGQPPTPVVLKSQIYNHVRPKSARPDNLEIYRGPPFGAGILATLFEEDFGDASKMRDRIEQGVEAAHQAGAGAAIFIPVVGVAVAAALEAGWQAYGDKVKSFVADRFGLEDDKIDTKSVFISPKQLILLSQAPRHEEHGISWHVNTPLLSGEGGSWRAYFNVEAEPHAASGPAQEPPRTLEIAQTMWPNRQDLARTQWNFADANSVGWAQASRAAAEICTSRGFAAGHFNGHQDLAKGEFGLSTVVKSFVLWVIRQVEKKPSRLKHIAHGVFD